MNEASRRTILHAASAASSGFFLKRVWMPRSAHAGSSAYAATGTPDDAVTLKGTVRYEGKAPKPIMRDITSDFETAGRGQRQWEGLDLDAAGGLARAVVVIDGIASGKAFMQGRNVAFAERATILDRVDAFGLAGEAILELENRDPILHTWAARLGQKQLLNTAQVPHMPAIKWKVKEAGLYELTCAPHPWERAFRMVVPHPYFTLTTPAGDFEITGVPRGQYTMTVWAEGIEPTQVAVDCTKKTPRATVTLNPSNLRPALRKNTA